MRPNILLSLTLVTAVAGCGGEAREQLARSAPPRDLTLVTGRTRVEIASPVETGQIRTQQRIVRPFKRASRPNPTPLVSAKVRSAMVWAPAPVPAAPSPILQPVSSAPVPDNDRELLPGNTVTLIPASTGPSVEADPGDDIGDRPMAAGGGGTCRGRGRRPGIGMAPAPGPDFR